MLRRPKRKFGISICGIGNADEVLSLLADQFALRNVLLQVLLDLAANDLPEPKIILFDIENHGFVADAGYEIEVRLIRSGRIYSFASPRAKMLAT